MRGVGRHRSKTHRTLGAIKKTSGNTIVKKLLDMLTAPTEKPSDEVVERGRIPYVIGQSIASEILHKCRPDRFVIRTSATGAWYSYWIREMGPAGEHGLFISTVRGFGDAGADCLAFDRGLYRPRYRYYIGDRFFQHIYDDPTNRTIISMYMTVGEMILGGGSPICGRMPA